MSIPVAVNLLTPSLNDESLPDRVVSVLAEHNIPAEALTIEITEDVLLAGVVRARSVLDRLWEKGVENAETADRLREYGCKYVHGHYFSPPVPAAAIGLGNWGSPPGTAASVPRLPRA